MERELGCGTRGDQDLLGIQESWRGMGTRDRTQGMGKGEIGEGIAGIARESLDPCSGQGRIGAAWDAGRCPCHELGAPLAAKAAQDSGIQDTQNPCRGIGMESGDRKERPREGRAFMVC